VETEERKKTRKNPILGSIRGGGVEEEGKGGSGIDRRPKRIPEWRRSKLSREQEKNLL